MGNRFKKIKRTVVKGVRKIGAFQAGIIAPLAPPKLLGIKSAGGKRAFRAGRAVAGAAAVVAGGIVVGPQIAGVAKGVAGGAVKKLAFGKVVGRIGPKLLDRSVGNLFPGSSQSLSSSADGLYAPEADVDSPDTSDIYRETARFRATGSALGGAGAASACGAAPPSDVSLLTVILVGIAVLIFGIAVWADWRRYRNRD